MLLGDARRILLDASDSPDRYDARTLALVEALSYSRRSKDSLTPEDYKLLDAAAVTYLTTPSRERKGVKHPPPKDTRARKHTKLSEHARELFWWLDQ